jgi:hypothetical protein
MTDRSSLHKPKRDPDRVDGATAAVWGDAIIGAIQGDRKELVSLLRWGNEVTRDAAEFLAWLIDERKNGRPPLPLKFRRLSMTVHPLFDPLMDFYGSQGEWYFEHPGKRFPFEQKLKEVIKHYGLDHKQEEALRNQIRRSEKSPGKIS